MGINSFFIKSKYIIIPTPGGTNKKAIFFTRTSAPGFTLSNLIRLVFNDMVRSIMPMTLPGIGIFKIVDIVSPIKRYKNIIVNDCIIFKW